MTYKKENNPVFDITDRNYNVKAFYLEEPKGEALIQITKDGKSLREFLFPAYKIWNIAAHFEDIVDSEFESGVGGYIMASSTGIN